MIRNWFRLVGCGNQGRRGSRRRDAGQVFFLQKQWSLQDHLQLSSAGNIHIGIAREKRDDPHGGSTGAKSCQTALYGMPGSGSANGADTGAGREGNLSHLAGFRPLSPFCWIVPSPSVLHGLVLCAGHAVDDAGDLDHGAVGKNDRCKVHVELRLALDAPAAHHAVNNSLHVDACRDHDAVADHHGKGGGKVDAVAGFGALGVDGAAQLQQNLGAGGHRVDFVCGGDADRGRWSGEGCVGAAGCAAGGLQVGPSLAWAGSGPAAAARGHGQRADFRRRLSG